MRTLVLGGTGMLGHQLVRSLSHRGETWVTTRAYSTIVESFGIPMNRQVTGMCLDAIDVEERLARLLDASSPDHVVNAVGALKPVRGHLDPIAAVRLNSLLPRILERLCSARGIKVIAISTDCVFSGIQGRYSERHHPDPTDLYGRTKLMGELSEPHLTIRTSIIGRELTGSRGLVEWFLANRGREVDGYANAVFSGLPTVTLANLIAQLIHDGPQLRGVFHDAADPIDKASLLRLLNVAFHAGVTINAKSEPAIDRSLDASRFSIVTGFRVPEWPQLVEALAADARGLDYDQLRQKD